MNEMKAAIIGGPVALPRSAFVGAWMARRAPPITARMSDNSAPFTSFSPVEEIAMLAGVRAQILHRGLHPAAEGRGRVPWPARIVKDAASERDHIGVTSADDRFGL